MRACIYADSASDTVSRPLLLRKVMSRRHQLPPLLCLLLLLQLLRHISAEERSTCIACSKSPDWDNNKTCRTQKRTLQDIGAGNEATVLQFNEGKVAPRTGSGSLSSRRV